MKKALSTAIIATVLIIGSAWADSETMTTGTTSTDTKQEMHQDRREVRQENREMRKDMKGEIKDFRKESRAEIKEAKAECKARLDAASTDAEKETIKAECRAESKEQREALRENIKTLRQETYTKMLTNIKSQLEEHLDDLKALSIEKKAEWKAKVTTRLDDLEDKANERGNDTLVLTITAIREIIAQV